MALWRSPIRGRLGPPSGVVARRVEQPVCTRQAGVQFPTTPPLGCSTTVSVQPSDTRPTMGSTPTSPTSTATWCSGSTPGSHPGGHRFDPDDAVRRREALSSRPTWVWRNGRRTGLRNQWPERAVQVQLLRSAPRAGLAKAGRRTRLRAWRPETPGHEGSTPSARTTPL